jgi:hypothetical protein
MRSVKVLIVLLCSALILGCSTSSGPAITQSGSQWRTNRLFLVHGGAWDEAGVYSMNPDASDARRIIAHADIFDRPQDTLICAVRLLEGKDPRDGSLIGADDSSDIILTDLEGQNERLIKRLGGLVFYALLSSDAKYILYTYETWENAIHVIVRNVETEVETELQDPFRWDIPAMSPNSHQVAFCGGLEFPRLDRINLDGSGRTMIADSIEFNWGTSGVPLKQSERRLDWGGNSIVYFHLFNSGDDKSPMHKATLGIYSTSTNTTTNVEIDSLFFAPLKVSPDGRYTIYQTVKRASWGQVGFNTTLHIYDLRSHSEHTIPLPPVPGLPDFSYGVLRDYVWLENSQEAILQIAYGSKDGPESMVHMMSTNVLTGKATVLNVPTFPDNKIY